MIGKTISHYKILEKLGEGGMGAVYKAQDTKLKREVALKFLPPQTTAGKADKARFEYEAQAAAALDHPNICTVYEINEADGQRFIAMAYVEGQSLQNLVAQGPLPLPEILNYANQIAEGLQAAHEKEIVHRDIKPANILLTEKGEVRISDFGLAKLARRTQLTKAGTSMGTVAYMSPEQAEGGKVDHRTDIWALGVVIYEMVTGKHPFAGDYEQAVVYSILNEDPEPPTALRTGVPIELERIILKCLAKEPAERYQHADDLLADLRRLQLPPKSTVQASPKVTAADVSRKRLPTFVFPLALLVVAIILGVGYLFMSREAESKERIPIAVVDFVNETKEEELNGLSGMLITALEQSRRLSVLTRSRMFDILKQMGKEDVDRIDEALGRQICQQANVNAMAIATIRKFGRLYTIDLKVFDPQKNEHLFTASEEGEGQESIPAMIGTLSEKTRRGLKEKAAEIQAASQSIAEVTTTNLKAYQHYFKGDEFINKLKFKEAEEELTKAIALDSTFALAYYRLAYARNWWNPDGAKEPIRKAMQYLDEAPEKEGYLIRALNARIAGNLDEAIALYQELLKLYPEEKEALYQIGDRSFHKADYATAITYLEKVLEIDPTFERAWHHIIWTSRAMGQHDQMLEYAKQYVAKTPTSEQAYDLLGDAYNLRAEFDHALQTYRQALELFPKSTMPIRGIGSVYIFKNKYEKAEAEFEKLLHDSRHRSHQRDGYRYLGWLYPYLGKYREAIKMIDRRIEIDRSLNDETDLAGSYAEKAFWFLVGWNDVENAREAIEKGLESKEAGDLFFYVYLLQSYLRMGEFQEASSIAKNLSRYIPVQDVVVNGHVHRAKGQYDEAIKNIQTVTQRGFLYDKVFQGYTLASWYFETRQHEKAIEVIRRIQKIHAIDVPLLIIFHAAVYPKSFYLLGKIYESKGDMKPAIESYETFLEFWKDADEDLPELIDAKTRLTKLRGG